MVPYSGLGGGNGPKNDPEEIDRENDPEEIDSRLCGSMTVDANG